MTIGGMSSDVIAKVVATDSNNNVYVAGYFGDYNSFISRSVDFNPGPGTDIHTSIGGYDSFLCKFDSVGNYIWTRTWGGIEWDFAKAVAVDSLNNVYVAGYYEETVDFDPGSGTDNRTAFGEEDCYLTKFDSSGNYLWALTWGAGAPDDVLALVIDSNDNAYVSGHYIVTVDFDPGPGIDNRTSNIDGYGFLSKFDQNGNYQWVITNDISIYSAAIDSTNNLYISGKFEDTIDFDPGLGIDNRTSVDNSDCFLSKYDSAGNYCWVRTWGDEGKSVTVDSNDDIYVSGRFYETEDFDPGPGIDNHTSDGLDCCISKFDPSGNYLWSQVWGGNQHEEVFCVSVDLNNNVYVVGQFGNYSEPPGYTVDFDPGSGIDNHICNGSSDCFISVYDSNGSYQWSGTWGSDHSYNEMACGVATDSLNNIYVAGFFYGTVDFNTDSGTDYHSKIGNVDAFISKFK